MANVEWQKIKRVLVIKLRHHGDVLLTSPVFNLIKDRYPSIEIDGLVYGETADMLRGLPSMSQLHLIERKKGKKESFQTKLHREKQLVQQLKERNYDLVIHLTESWRGAILCRLLKPKYSIVAKYKRESRNSKLWKSSFTHHYPVPFNRHTVDQHIDSLRALGLHPETDAEQQLELFVNDDDRSHVLNILKRNGLHKGNYILFHPTSRWLFKCWKESSAAKVIDQLICSGYPVVVTSGPDNKEQAMVQRILDMCKTRPVNLSGQTTLKQLGALIDYSSLFLGVDSVPMHIAAAFQKPTVVLFGPSGEKMWGPWKTLAKVLTSDVGCRPCGMDGCAGSKISACLYSIQPETVFNSITSLVEPQNTSPRIKTVNYA